MTSPTSLEKKAGSVNHAWLAGTLGTWCVSGGDRGTLASVKTRKENGLSYSGTLGGHML